MEALARAALWRPAAWSPIVSCIALEVGSEHIHPAIKNLRPFLPIFRDIALTTGARIYSTILSIAALALTARWLGPHGRGVGVVVTTWTSMVSSILYLSLGQVCIHRASTETDIDWIGPTVSALALVASMTTLVGWGTVALLYMLGGTRLFGGIPTSLLALGFAALPFLIWEQYGSALLSVMDRLAIYNINQVVGRSVGLIVLIVAVKVLDLGVLGFILAFVIGQVISSSAGVLVIFRHARGRMRGGLQVMGNLVRDGIKIHLNTIGTLLFSGADVLMLQYFRGPTETGLFQLPMQLFLALLLVPQSVLLALQARVASRTASGIWPEQRAIMTWVILVMTLAAGILWTIAPSAVTLVASERFSESIPVFRILMFAVPVACFNTLMAIQWITRGYFLQGSLITLATGLLNCTLNLFLIPRFGAEGAAFATVAGVYVIPLTANSWLAHRATREVHNLAIAND